MHRACCEVALLKLLRQKMRRKTKTCYCVRNIRNALVRHKSADQCSRNQTHLEKKIYLFLLLLLKEKGYIFYNAKIENNNVCGNY